MTQPHFNPDEIPLESSPCLQGERVTFTGTLASMTHAAASRLVEENGGIATEHVSRHLTMLVLGEEGWALEDNGQPSVKFQQVERWIQSGADIQILNESQWLTLLGLNDHREEVHRLYTPAMLSTILGISVHTIRSWERSGLIRPVRKVHRLPYFDFREVSSARRLSELIESGISQAEIETSLKRLPSVRRGDERPLEQLEILGHQLGVLVRDHYGLVIPGKGQRVFDFERTETPSCQEPNEDSLQILRIALTPQGAKDPQTLLNRDWLIEGCRLYDAGQLHEALDAFRLAAMSSPQSSDVHFQMGECLYRMGQTEAALERYYVAVEQDADFLEAWTQIGCLQNELARPAAACDAFRVALTILPEYPDAHYHLAETLNELGQVDEACLHWEEYLQHDHRGPWADIARQRLEQMGSRPD